MAVLRSLAHMEDRFGHHISYLRVSITDRCNERCIYCMPQELQEWLPRSEVLNYDEITRLVRIASELGVVKVRITGGEPLTRRDVLTLFRQLNELPRINDIGVSTNGSLLPKPLETGETLAEALMRFGVRTANISLDTLDREKYRAITGRDFLQQTLDGIAAAKAARFEKVKLNAVLMRGRNEEDIGDLIRFARNEDLLLRFIELMPVSTIDVLNEENFLSVGEARRKIEAEFGPLIPEPEFRTNGPALYYRFQESRQRIGFIGAMTNLHFCESCNKLRLTCDGKLRPCLGSHLEFDIKTPMRQGASDEQLRRFFLEVVDRKPQQHDFRYNYQPGRKMVAIGG
jgi:cyclic pyranopterin phosphate synthase